MDKQQLREIEQHFKLDADWRPGTTPEMIELLYRMTLLHFKDFRRAMYGGGNYRLVQTEKKRYGVSRAQWEVLSEDQRTKKFEMFLKHANKKKENKVKSTYSDFTVQKPSRARKPGQRKRIKSAKTSKKY